MKRKKKKITIGIDIDDTITNSCQNFIKYAKIYNEEKGIEYEIDLTQWDLNKTFGWNENNFKEFAKEYLKTLLEKVETKEGVVEIIKKLKSEGQQIIFITARHEKELGDPYLFTKKWLEANNISYDKLIVNSKRKELDCLNNNVDLFIDDSFTNCVNVYENLHIPVFLFNTVYNKGNNYPNIERIYSWEEAYSKIKKYIKSI